MISIIPRLSFLVWVTHLLPLIITCEKLSCYAHTQPDILIFCHLSTRLWASREQEIMFFILAYPGPLLYQNTQQVLVECYGTEQNSLYKVGGYLPLPSCLKEIIQCTKFHSLVTNASLFSKKLIVSLCKLNSWQIFLVRTHNLWMYTILPPKRSCLNTHHVIDMEPYII